MLKRRELTRGTTLLVLIEPAWLDNGGLLRFALLLSDKHLKSALHPLFRIRLTPSLTRFDSSQRTTLFFTDFSDMIVVIILDKKGFI
jgi:hypothetical protein